MAWNHSSRPLTLNTDQYATIFKANYPDRFQFNINHVKSHMYKGKKITTWIFAYIHCHMVN